MSRQPPVSRLPHDEWLGPESHVPNLSGELRRQNPRSWHSLLPWLAGGLFMTGFLTGSAAAWLLYRSRRSA
ncbi:MAG TPA: hypothetical protein VJ746_20380 [Nitrospira sp.]|nr:hypothetical protein [Nitrospira sp.]